MILSAKKLYLLLMSLVVVSILALGVCVYLAGGILQKKSQDVHNASLKSLALEKRQEQLFDAKSDIARYGDLAKIAKSIVPRDKDQARTVREINKLAQQNNVTLGSITFPSSALGEQKATNEDSQLKPVAEIPGTYSLSIDVRSDTAKPTSYDDFINFLESLEQNRRTALVTGITLTPESDNPNSLQFTLIIQEYIKP